jgi:predicted nucleic acid-binding protein
VPVWDTSVASGLNPDGLLFRLAAEAASAGKPVRVAAPTVAEIFFGLERRCADKRFVEALGWFTEILDAGLFELLPVTHETAILAGRLRALHPAPPTSRRRADGRSKPERRVAWVADIQIAACAWAHGEGVCTADHQHFDLLREGISQLFPAEGPLQVLPAPS